MDFIAIDLETANADMASICQIGVASYKNGEVVSEWTSLVDPEDYFDEINVSIHGISESSIKDAPKFSEIYPTLASIIRNTVCVSHTHFDRVSLDKAIRKNNLHSINLTWLDSARVARRAWEECAWKGYGLSSVCKIIGFEFKHHDALEDAKACGAVLIAAMSKTGMDVNGWLTRVGQPIDENSTGRKVSLEGNPEGEFYGQSVVFTGALSIPRKEAAVLAAGIGCAVASSVTKKTNYLVVGDQDIIKLAGKEKSSKHIKAEQLITKGQSIRILKESDFLELVKNVNTVA